MQYEYRVVVFQQADRVLEMRRHVEDEIRNAYYNDIYMPCAGSERLIDRGRTLAQLGVEGWSLVGVVTYNGSILGYLQRIKADTFELSNFGGLTTTAR